MDDHIWSCEHKEIQICQLSVGKGHTKNIWIKRDIDRSLLISYLKTIVW
jgi:hypothetical protein